MLESQQHLHNIATFTRDHEIREYLKANEIDCPEALFDSLSCPGAVKAYAGVRKSMLAAIRRGSQQIQNPFMAAAQPQQQQQPNPSMLNPVFYEPYREEGQEEGLAGFKNHVKKELFKDHSVSKLVFKPKPILK